MENNLQIFTNDNFGSIRSVEINGKPYFVANDIARALGYKRPADAVTMHCKGSVKYRYLTPGGEQEVKVIPEGDLYRLIIKSKLPEAEKFESWIMDDVLPTLRETGKYSLNNPKPDSYMIEDPIARAQRWIEEQQEKKELEAKTIELTETNQKLEKERDELIPKAEFGGMIGISNDCITMEEMAKVLHSHGIKDIGRNRLFAWLRAEKVLQRNNLPYQRYLESGFFKVHEYTYADRRTGERRIRTQTTVTPTGQMSIVHSWVTWLKGANLEECN